MCGGVKNDSRIYLVFDMQDDTRFHAAADDIAAQIAAAESQKTPLILQGSGGKDFYGNPATGKPLDLSSLSGVLDYAPSELFIAAGAATSLSEVENMLSENAQMLAFEPPHFGGATVGGALACGLSGPRRPAGGALRDHVLGIGLIDGRGRRLSFGGKVIKNVAGFDVSRLMAGALGVYGAISDVVFRVSPVPECEATTVSDCDADEAIASDNAMLAAGMPLTGGVWHDGRCWRRFSGGEQSLRRAVRECGGDLLDDESHLDFWRAVREQTHPFFTDNDTDLWRIVSPATAPAGDVDFIEWHGATRWRRCSREDALLSSQQAGGAATLFRAADSKTADRFPSPPPPLMRICRNLKNALDPENILNRGRLYDFGAE